MKKENLREMLERLDFLEGVPGRVLLSLEEKLIRITFDKGSYVIRAGSAGSAFYILTSGSVSVLREDGEGREIKVATLRAPSYFGEIAHLDERVRMASVRAEEDITAYLLKKEDYELLVSLDPRIRESLRKIAVRRKAESKKASERATGLTGREDAGARQAGIQRKELPGRETSPAPPAGEGSKVGAARGPSSGPAKKQDHVKQGIIRKLSLRSLCLFTLQFSTMFNAGLGYVAALKVLSQTSDANLNRISDKISASVQSGHRLWRAMELIPDAFSSFYINVVRQNEEMGNLPEGMRAMAEYLAKEERKRCHLVQALVYPLIVLVSSILMVSFLVFYIFPKFMPLFAAEGAEIPWATRALLSITSTPLVSVSLSLVMAALAALVLSYLYGNPAGRRRIVDLLSRLPVVGHLMLASALARLARTLAVMLSGGGGLLYALDTLKKTPMGYSEIDQAIEGMATLLSEHGSSLEEALGNFPVFPRSMVYMVAAGEHVGNVSVFLNKFADLAEIEVDTATSSLLSVIEPLMLFGLGIVVGFVVLAAFLPVFQLIKNI
ncbi:MAG: type II secretion system F family protein [Candidatus Eremiobacteraeota bacterium]|nr:type II secretion system F family protein [Candidatus Eremiobacteraeota bacterium]